MINKIFMIPYKSHQGSFYMHIYFQIRESKPTFLINKATVPVRES